MTKTLDKTELVRLAWLTELRRQGHRKCEWADVKRGKGICALQLLAELCPKEEDGNVRHWGDVGRYAGLSYEQQTEVYCRNDGVSDRGTTYHKHTFAEIADVVEGWFK